MSPGPDPTGLAAGVPRVVLDDPQQLIGHTILGRFRVDGVLGVGGMAAVLRCHHLGLQRDIAVKVLHPEMSASPEVSARFAREAQAMSRMNHPNCVRVLDFGEFDVGGPSFQYLAMELLAGCELTEFMGQPLPPLRAIELMDQIFSGLFHAHAAGVVHRDLKPENVFVTTDHEDAELIKIVDFGIAKIVSGQGSRDNMTVAGTIFGTPRYMSPEQCAGGEIDERTDVYAAGIILYETLAGHVPFDNPEDPVKVIHKHILEPVPALMATTPQPLVQLVMGMLEKEKAKRIASIGEAQSRLADIGRGLANGTLMSMPAMALAPNSVNAGAGLMARPNRRRGVMVGAALGVTLVLGIIAWGLGASKDTAVEIPIVTVAPSGPAASTKPVAAAAPAIKPPAALAALLAAGSVPPQADDAEITKLEAMLKDGATDLAMDAIGRLLDDFPRDAQLYVMRGRAQTDSDKVAALAAFSKALELRPALTEDEDFREELLALMGDKKVGEPALDLAIRQLGDHGIPYLLKRVNDDARPIPYADRKRALKALDESGRAGEIETELNVALDLWQAGDARKPCLAYGDALDRIEREPAAYYLGSVMRSTPPAGCDGLRERRGLVGEALVAEFTVAESEWVVPERYARKRSRRKKRSGGSRGGILRRLGLH